MRSEAARNKRWGETGRFVRLRLRLECCGIVLFPLTLVILMTTEESQCLAFSSGVSAAGGRQRRVRKGRCAPEVPRGPLFFPDRAGVSRRGGVNGELTGEVVWGPA